jgi:hypothetical protein
MMLIDPQVEGQARGNILFYSVKGPGSMHAPLIVSLVVGLGVGFLAQRSRFCTIGAFRDLILFRQSHLFMGVLGFAIAAFITNLILEQFHPGFTGQPVAHTMHVWNFAGMALAGLAFALAGGCPGRQLFLAGEGDGDAAIFVSGMIIGAGFAHNFGLASSPNGVSPNGIAAVMIGLAVCLFIGFTIRSEMPLFSFAKKKVKSTPLTQNQDRGILVFENTSEVIRAENILKTEGWKIRVMGPPPEIRTACDLVIEFPLIEKLYILRKLDEVRVKPIQVVPVSNTLLKPVDLFHIKDLVAI